MIKGKTLKQLVSLIPDEAQIVVPQYGYEIAPHQMIQGICVVIPNGNVNFIEIGDYTDEDTLIVWDHVPTKIEKLIKKKE